MQNYRGRNRYTRELYVSEVKAILIALGVVIALLLTGCSGPRHGIEENGYRRFKAVATYADGTEIVDKDTGFGYFVFSGAAASCLFWMKTGTHTGRTDGGILARDSGRH